MTHPYARFKAPASIQTGTPLKMILDRGLVRLIADSLQAVVPDLARAAFTRAANKGLEELELSERARHIASAMRAVLPDEPVQASACLTASLGPELTQTEDNGLKPFFYLPHSHFVAQVGSEIGTEANEEAASEIFAAGMQANYELTKRFTAEFSIRSYVIADLEHSLSYLQQWVTDENPHVRRLVSEGTRPRLPWAGRLPALQADPQIALPLLEQLKDDPSLYVRRSVANHLGDLLKDHPDVIYVLCQRWVDEVAASDASDDYKNQRYWMIRHAVRHPAKKGAAPALALRQAAAIIRKKRQ